MVNYLYDFRECANILHHRDWSDEAHKTHFESGVRMGIGTFNLVCLSSFVIQNYDLQALCLFSIQTYFV